MVVVAPTEIDDALPSEARDDSGTETPMLVSTLIGVNPDVKDLMEECCSRRH